MSLATAAAAHGSPSLCIAPTQNTAPVHEFGCLFTSDLRKKKKIWHDGSLRFHTFNKRVMVYDESKNYIGDAHLREEGELQEGEELRLDKGVLVEVGQRVGHSETDLGSVILDRRRLTNTSSVPAPLSRPSAYSPQPGPRLGITSAQSRPKSLISVLGAQNGPLGRARFPTQSPFEQRHPNLKLAQHADEERGPKRIRRSFEKENLDCSSASKNAAPFSPTKSKVSANWPERILTAATTKPSVGAQQRGNGLSSHSPSVQHNQLSTTKLQSQSKATLVANTNSADLASKQSVPQDTLESQNNPLKPPFLLGRKQNASCGQETAFLQPRDREHESSQDIIPRAKTDRGIKTNRLQFAKEPARSKLLYKTSRLGSQCSQSHLAAGLRRNPSGCLHDDVSDLPAPEPASARLPSANDRAHGINRRKTAATSIGLNHRASAQRTSKPAKEPVRSPRSLARSRRSLSPLFCDQAPILCQTIRTEPESASYEHSPIRSIPASRPKPTEGIHALSAAAGPIKEATSNAQNSASVGRELRDSFGPDLPAQTTAPNEQRLFRRIASENDACIHGQAAELPRLKIGPSGGEDQQAAPRAESSLKQQQQRCRGQTSLRRSTSDTADKRPGTSASSIPKPKPTTATATVEAPKFDPWSEAEASILFDWWPPDREKPPYLVA